MRQSWRDLLFLHWRLAPTAIAPRLPASLKVDLFDGAAWLGVVPFFMRDVRPAGCPPLPWLSDFLELNVRTYVIGPDGTPGVWFFSLDCDRWPAVEVARRWFHLAYEHAAMRAVRSDGVIDYRCRRRGAASEAVYRWPPSAGRHLATARPGTLEFFLLERYRLFAHDPRRDRLFTGAVAHAPYRYLELPEGAVTWSPEPLRWDGFEVAGGTTRPAHCCVSPGVQVEIFAPRRVPAIG